MPTKKITKRGLTDSEKKKIRVNLQRTTSGVNSLINNERINTETKAALRKVHKCLVDAVAYSGRLNFL